MKSTTENITSSITFEKLSRYMSEETKEFYRINPRNEYYKKLIIKYTSREAKVKDLIGITSFCVEYLIHYVKNRIKHLI